MTKSRRACPELVERGRLKNLHPIHLHCPSRRTNLPLRLMCFTAHPDDECGAFGGALMMAHQRGVETSVVCLTEGRAGSHRGNARNDDELAQLRRHEFAAALRVL